MYRFLIFALFLTLKQICVEINFQNDYVIILGIELLQNDKRLNRLKKHKSCASAVLAVYLLSESDYLSSFFGLSSKHFFQALCNFIEHTCISPEDGLFVKTETKDDNSRMWQSENGLLKLLCSTYLSKYQNLFKHIKNTPPELYNLFCLSLDNQSDGLKHLREWIGFDTKQNCTITGLNSWIEFTRRICYFSNQEAENLYRQIQPSDTAFRLQKLRIDFVLNIAIENCLNFPNFI